MRQPSQKLSRPHHPATKSGGYRIEIPLIESNNGMRLAVHGSFQNHIVIRVRQRRAPTKGKPHAPFHGGQAIEHILDIFHARARRRQVLRASQNRLVFKHQRHREKYLRFPCQCHFQ